MATILVCLAVLVASALPALATGTHGAEPAAASHHDVSHHAAHGDAAEVCADADCPADTGSAGSRVPDLCLGGGHGVHCAAALTAPVRDGTLLRLGRQWQVGLHPDTQGPHRTPETETPPPRV